MYYPDLANRVRYLKEDPEGVEEMCQAMEKIRQDDERRTNMKNSVIYVRNLSKNGDVSVDKAMELLEIPIEVRPVVAQLVSSPTYYG